ncbi:hypothetical protein C8Q77DRAFT_821703 [Trametes polyzona]|nr:hypothetical protein C8Q77DRAFT_821703 [Trametes polyzona]
MLSRLTPQFRSYFRLRPSVHQIPPGPLPCLLHPVPFTLPRVAPFDGHRSPRRTVMVQGVWHSLDSARPPTFGTARWRGTYETSGSGRRAVHVDPANDPRPPRRINGSAKWPWAANSKCARCSVGPASAHSRSSRFPAAVRPGAQVADLHCHGLPPLRTPSCFSSGEVIPPLLAPPRSSSTQDNRPSGTYTLQFLGDDFGVCKVISESLRTDVTARTMGAPPISQIQCVPMAITYRTCVTTSRRPCPLPDATTPTDGALGAEC